jgi:hypothetical protein
MIPNGILEQQGDGDPPVVLPPILQNVVMWLDHNEIDDLAPRRSSINELVILPREIGGAYATGKPGARSSMGPGDYAYLPVPHGMEGGDRSFTIASWIQISQGTDAFLMCVASSNTNADTDWALYLGNTGVKKFHFFIFDGTGTYVSSTTEYNGAIGNNTLYGIIAEYNHATQEMHIEINRNPNPVKKSVTTRHLSGGDFFLNGRAHGTGSYLDLDTTVFIDGLWTEAQKDEWYNSGSGADFQDVGGTAFRPWKPKASQGMTVFDGTSYFWRNNLNYNGNRYCTVAFEIEMNSFTGGGTQTLVSAVNASWTSWLRVVFYATDHSNVDLAGKMRIFQQYYTTPYNLVKDLISTIDVMDGQKHSVVYSSDCLVNNSAVLWVDGQNADDLTYPDRQNITGNIYSFGNFFGLTVGCRHYDNPIVYSDFFIGKLGAFYFSRGHRCLTVSECFNSDGDIEIDQDGYHQFGARPSYGNSTGQLEHTWWENNTNGVLQPIGSGITTELGKSYDFPMYWASTAGTFDTPAATYNTTSNKFTVIFRLGRQYPFTTDGGNPSGNGGFSYQHVWRRYTASGTGGATANQSCYALVRALDVGDPDRDNKLQFIVQDTTGTNIVNVASKLPVIDAQDHMVFFSFDGDTGTVVFFVDGVDADNLAYAGRIATAGTLTTYYDMCWMDAFYRYYHGYYGMMGYMHYTSHAALTNPLDFMDEHLPIQIDQTLWTEFSGVQPEHSGIYGLEFNAGTGPDFRKDGLVGPV